MLRVDYDDVVRFQSALKRTNPEIKAKLKAVNRNTAQMVVDVAQAKAGSVGRQAAKAASTLRAANTVGSSQVKGGSGRLPWFKGAEFGSKRYAQFQSWRGNASTNAFDGGAGYFLFPAIREHREQILGLWRDGINDALKPAFN